MRRVFVVAGKRTPIGALQGSLQSFTGPQLGSLALKAIIDETKLNTKLIDQVILGNVLGAGLGQNPARQASLASGIDLGVPCYSINKVCASGLKTICIGASEIMASNADIIMAGGFESMSNAPHMLKSVRGGVRFGDSMLLDSISTDGLVDAYSRLPMGVCTEKTAKEMGITRELQDEYAIKSYERALKSIEAGVFNWEVIPVDVPKKGIVNVDDEPQRFNREKMTTFKPAFADKSGVGTITAGNASKINDGACAFLLMGEEGLKKSGLKPIAEILSYADAEGQPVDFNLTPPIAIRKAMSRIGFEAKNIDFWEINEAFSVTAIAAMKVLGIGHERINVHGGAVALGHPIGASGSRIVLSLINVLRRQNGEIGCAAICNGGGGATALIIKKM